MGSFGKKKKNIFVFYSLILKHTDKQSKTTYILQSHRCRESLAARSLFWKWSYLGGNYPTLFQCQSILSTTILRQKGSINPWFMISLQAQEYWSMFVLLYYLYYSAFLDFGRVLSMLAVYRSWQLSLTFLFNQNVKLSKAYLFSAMSIHLWEWFFVCKNKIICFYKPQDLRSSSTTFTIALLKLLQLPP